MAIKLSKNYKHFRMVKISTTKLNQQNEIEIDERLQKDGLEIIQDYDLTIL